MMITNGTLALTEYCLHSRVDECLSVKHSIDYFWNLETIGIQDSPYTPDDGKALRNSNSTLKIKKQQKSGHMALEGRIPDLYENRELTYWRFKSLVHNLQSNSELLHKYNEIIQGQCKKEIIEKV